MAHTGFYRTQCGDEIVSFEPPTPEKPCEFRLVFRERSNAMLACMPPRAVPDNVWRETWAWDAVVGIITRKGIEYGVHKPAAQVEEKIMFQSDAVSVPPSSG